MTGMAYWAVVVPAERYETERLYHHETLTLDEPLQPGDEVLLVAGTDPPTVFAAGRVSEDPAVVAYTRRSLDTPHEAGGLAPGEIDESTFAAYRDRLTPPGDRRDWLVSVDLPIEAESPAEAVREFWTYVMRLGPRELPAFVTPAGDELAMQAYVLSEPVSLDPEEDEP